MGRVAGLGQKDTGLQTPVFPVYPGNQGLVPGTACKLGQQGWKFGLRNTELAPGSILSLVPVQETHWLLSTSLHIQQWEFGVARISSKVAGFEQGS